MPTTSRMKWPYPAENQDPFFSSFEAMVTAMDASSFVFRENDSILIMKGGSVSFAALSGLLTWDATLELNSAVTGFKWNVPAGSINLADGEYWYVTLAHNPITNTTIVSSKASKLPDSDPDNPYVLGLRNGDRVYFRGGKVLLDAQTLSLFQTMPGGGGGGVGTTGQKWRENVALTISNQNSSGTAKVMGAYSTDADDYTLNLTNKAFTFMAIANVDVGTVSGEIVLWNLTTAAAAATITVTGLTAPTKFAVAASINTVENIYEVRGRVTAGTGTLFVNWAGLQIDNVIV
jgi:hypothetical protein